MMRRFSKLALLALFVTTACGSDDTSPANPSDAGGGDSSARADGGSDAASQPDSRAGDGATGMGIGLSAKYPGDVGMDKDPAVVWMENFEEGALAAFAARYSTVSNQAGMKLTGDVPKKSSGKASITLTSSGDGANATDFYKSFPKNYDDWYVRWYAKYQGSVKWHHSGVWLGGYDPPTPWANPQAGLKPAGNDRFAVAMEPVWNVGTASAQFDFYDYWMQMHSWMAMPMGSTAYYGNALVNQNGFGLDEGSWVCLEVHVKMNTDLAAGTGGALEVWKNDALVASYGDAGPKGYWIRDKFCTPQADGTQCTNYPAPFDTVLDLQWRSTSSLALNYFWPQNYITDAGVTGDLAFDDMVIATTRIGCTE